MLTLGECKSLLSRYVGANNTANDRISLVTERLMKSGNWRNSKELVTFTVYADSLGRSVITLPRGLNTILGGSFLSSTTGYGYPLPVQNSWYQFHPNGVGYYGEICGPGFEQGFLELPGRYVTFLDWTEPLKLRLKLERDETSAYFIIKGMLNGEKIFSLDHTATWIEGVELNFSTTTVTSIVKFDSVYQIIKPVTLGRLYLYVVDDSDNETQVASYEPTETSPSYKRYRVPNCETPVTVPASVSGGTITFTNADIDGLSGNSGDITVPDLDLYDLAPPTEFFQWIQRIYALDNGGTPYTSKFTLDSLRAKDGAIFRVILEMEQSADPTIEIYNDDVSGELLGYFTGDSSNPVYAVFETWFDGANWHRLSGNTII